jgi:assimilatory nitrate reductase catalytic subunit
MNLRVEGERVEVEARPFAAHQGGLCQKGWSAAELLGHPERLTTPLLRKSKDAPLCSVSWEEALDFVAQRVAELQAQHGRDSVGVFGGGGLTNEKAYLLGKFARVALKTSQIDYNGRFCMSSAAAASIAAFGIDRGLPFPLSDIAGAECVLLAGSNLAETMPPIMQYFQAQRTKGGSLIVVDPRRTPTAAAATLHLQITPGTDSALANGLLHIAIKERLIDARYIAERTVGFEAVQRVVARYWPARVERITGVPEKQLEVAARLLAMARTAMILTARGPEQQSKGVENVASFINLALALGLCGKPYSGYGCLTGQGNGQGGREHGQKADQLPGYRKIENFEHRREVAHVWGVKEEDLPRAGKPAYEMLDSIGSETGLRALLVFASNPVVSAPRALHVEERLRALDLLVASDFFLSETAALADVVLPTTQWAEEEGTMTNLEGRVILRRRSTEPPVGARSDLAILSALAERMGVQLASTNREVFDELRRASAGGVADYAGITYERIVEEQGVFWPCPHVAHPGTPRLFLERFATEDGRARFQAVEFRHSAEEPDAEYPLYLTTGRVVAHYQSGTQTRRVEKSNNAVREAFVEIHPATAVSYGIAENDDVLLATRRGTAMAKARLTHTIRIDTIFVPFHFAARGRANLLTNPAVDPVSKMPEFKVCAARVSKATGVLR